MPRPYSQEDYEALARAVLAGMPEEQAEKTLEEQRTKGGKGEQAYWLTLKEEAKTTKTTIQISRGLKGGLDELKVHPKEAYEEVIKRIKTEALKVPHLEAENEKLREKIKELEKIIIEDREMRG